MAHQKAGRLDAAEADCALSLAPGHPQALPCFQSGNPFTDATFRARFDAVLDEWGIARDRLLILPYLTHDDYLRVNIHSDVMVDCLTWSGGNTSIDAIV